MGLKALIKHYLNSGLYIVSAGSIEFLATDQASDTLEFVSSNLCSVYLQILLASIELPVTGNQPSGAQKLEDYNHCSISIR